MQQRRGANRLEQFSALIHLIYAASAKPQRWQQALAAIAKAMKAHQALLFTPFVGPGSGGLLFPWQIDERHLNLWASKYIDHDIWAQSAQRKDLWHEGAVLVDEDLAPWEELRASMFYREFLTTIGIARVCVGIVFEGSPGLPSTSLSVFRGPGDDPFAHKERDLMQLLVPHLSRALGLMHRLSLARHQVASMRAALDRLSVGVFLLNQHLDVIYANTAGRQVLARKDGIGTDQQTRLTATGLGTGSLRLEDWLARMVSLPKLERGGFDDTFDVARHKSKTRYSVQCCPLEPQDPLFSGEGAHHIVFVTDPQRLELPALAALQRQLGLTPAEARVTKALVQGGTYCEVAATMGVREETIRSQVKSVYAKTRTNTKAGLTRMVLSLSKATV